MNTKTLKAKCVRALAVRAEIDRLSEERKALYEEHDVLVGELRNQKGLETHGVKLVSSFAKGNTQWGHGPVRELVLEPVEKSPKK